MRLIPCSRHARACFHMVQALKRYLHIPEMEQPFLKSCCLAGMQELSRSYLDPDALIPAHTANQIFILLPLAQTILCKLLRVADLLPRRLEILFLQLLALPQDLLNRDLQA